MSTCETGSHIPVPLTSYPDPNEEGWTYFECSRCNAAVKVSNQQIRAWTYTGVSTSDALNFLLTQIQHYHWQPRKH